MAADPAAAGEPLGSAFPAPRPLRQVALVGIGDASNMHLIRYDLRKSPFPLDGAPLLQEGFSFKNANSYALSPDGERLAILSNGRHTIGVWNADGKMLATFRMPIEGKQYYEGKLYAWIGLLTSDRLTALTDEGHVVEYELPSGEVVADRAPEANAPLRQEPPVFVQMVADRALGVQAPVVLSPGRKFAAATPDDGFAWFRLPEWEPAGTLRLPEGMPAGLPQPSAAVSLDASAFAAYFPVMKSPTELESHVVLTWDVISGTLKDAVRIPAWRLYNFGVWPTRGIRWAGPRQLWLGGVYLIDLDLREHLWTLNASLAESPDGRVWQLASNLELDHPDAKGVWAKVTAGRGAPFPETRTFLIAGTPPVEAIKARLGNGARLDRSRPVRAEVSCADEATRTSLAEALSAALAANGFTVDSDAQTTLRLTFKRAHFRIADIARRVTSTSAINTNRRQPFVASAALVQFIGSDGDFVWTGNWLEGTHNVGPQIDKAEAEELYPEEVKGVVRDPPTEDYDAKYPAEVVKAQESLVPKLEKEFSNFFPERQVPNVLAFAADGKVIRLPLVWAIGIDGHSEARIEEMK